MSSIKEIYNSFDTNFSNRVPQTNSKNFMQCDGGIMLEPRLQEYFKKKKYYKDNSINTMTSLEKEFMITSEDIKTLRLYFSGRRDIYSKDVIERDEKPMKKQYFPSRELRKEIREAEIPKKRDHVPMNFYDGDIESDNYKSDYSSSGKSSKRVYKNDKKNEVRQMRNNDESNFRVNTRNNDVENNLIMQDQSYRPKNKSVGYRNPVENHFQYIDNEYSNPNNFVEPWDRGGSSTRLDNKAVAKKREVI